MNDLNRLNLIYICMRYIYFHW